MSAKPTTSKPAANPENPTQSGSGSDTAACSPLKVLRLTLKRKWFDMIASGEKREEYRTPGPWIDSRLDGKDYDLVEFKNGYGADVPTIYARYLGSRYGIGNPEWGAQPGQAYRVILLGEILPENDQADTRHE